MAAGRLHGDDLAACAARSPGLTIRLPTRCARSSGGKPVEAERDLRAVRMVLVQGHRQLAALQVRVALLRPAAMPANLQCGELSVPLDYDHPHGAKITLGFNRLPAADRAHRVGSLIINPGGPGGAGSDFVRWRRPAAISGTPPCTSAST